MNVPADSLRLLRLHLNEHDTMVCVLSSLLQPPPPGHPPNAAQLAAMQGANVVMTQRKSNWFTGGSSGGYTIW